MTINKAVFPLQKSMCNFNFIITICILEKSPWNNLFYFKISAKKKKDLAIAIESLE